MSESESSQHSVEEDDEEAIAAQIVELKKRLESNPYDFVAYCELIQKHRGMGDLDETRTYR